MRQASILGGLLAVALVGSYWSWTHPPEDNAKVTDVIAVRSDASTLKSVTWKDDKKTIVMTHPKDGAGEYVWFEVSETTVDKTKPPTETTPPADPAKPDDAAKPTDPAAAADPAKPAEPVPPPATITTTTRFEGSTQANDLWKQFGPLYALRELTIAPGTTLEAYGLDKPKATVEVAMEGSTVTLQVGGEAYGTRDRYVSIDGKIFLIDDEVLRPLEFAKSRLVERALFPLEEKDILAVSVKNGTTQRVFAQKNADDRPKAFWADVTAADERDVEATAWLGKLFRLRVKDYVDKADVPTDAKPVFAFDVKGSKDTWTVTVVSTQKDGATEYYALSSYNRAVVSLTRSLADEAIADLPALFDGKKVEEDATDAPADPNAPPSPVPAGSLPPAAQPVPAGPGGAPPAPPAPPAP